MLPLVYNVSPPMIEAPLVAPAPVASGKRRVMTSGAPGGVLTVSLPPSIPERCVSKSAADYAVNPLLLLAMIKVDGDIVAGAEADGDQGESRALRERRARYAPMVARASVINGVPVPLIDAVITVESRYMTTAVSPKGAIGLMQLMPGTARQLGVNPKDDWSNILGGSRYLAQLGRKFSWNLNLMIAAFNAGPGAVEKNGYRVPNYAETQDYVPKVMGIYASLANSSNDPASTQFSESAWAKKLETSFHIPREALARNVCQALRGMAYAVRSEIDAADGDIWKGVGNYHADSAKYRQIYVSRVLFAYKQMVSKGSF
jgi:soluble lytic murein transglycosylase-like protein